MKDAQNATIWGDPSIGKSRMMQHMNDVAVRKAHIAAAHAHAEAQGTENVDATNRAVAGTQTAAEAAPKQGKFTMEAELAAEEAAAHAKAGRWLEAGKAHEEAIRWHLKAAMGLS